MLIVPVLDIKNGIVVHAKKGERDHYRSVESVLIDQADPHSVLSAYYKLYPFNTIYIADLDAIEGHADNLHKIKEICGQHPACEFWLDPGLKIAQEVLRNPTHDNLRIVIGSENTLSKENYLGLISSYPEIILSLDFHARSLIDNHYLLDEPTIWPKHVITMSLDRVGTNIGIDIEHINKMKQMNVHSLFYVAGGIRNIEDIKQLEKAGINGCLIATALHSGEITKKNLEQLNN